MLCAQWYMTAWTSGWLVSTTTAKAAIKLHGCCSIGYIVMSDHSIYTIIELAWVTCPATHIIELLSQDEHIPRLLIRFVLRLKFYILIWYELHGVLWPLRVTSLVDMKTKTFRFMLTHCKIFYVLGTYIIFHASGHADPVEIADRGAVDKAVDRVFSFYTLPCLLLGALKRGV